MTSISDIRTALDALEDIAKQDVEVTVGQRAYIAGVVSALRWVLGETDQAYLLIPREPLV